MKLRLLGSAAGKTIPRPFCACRVCRHAKADGGKNVRTRTSMQVFLPDDDEREPRHQVDLSRDTGGQMVRFRFNLSRLEHLLFTHSDEDHIDPSTLKYRRTILSDREQMPPLNIYGSTHFCKKFRTLRFDFERLKIALHPVRPYRAFSFGEIDVVPLLARHTDDALNYVLSHDRRTVLLAWDTGLWPEENWERIGGLRFDAVFMECTVLGKREVSREAGHLNFAHLLEMKDRLGQLGCIRGKTPFVAVHIGDNGGLTHTEAVGFAAPHGVIVGYDGMDLEV